MATTKNQTYIGFWSRFGAMILDVLILDLPATIIGGILWMITGLRSFYGLTILITIIITIYMDGIKGGTPGKLILNMRIINEKGNFIGIPVAILRYISTILSAIIIGIGFFMIGWDTRKQGLHDKIAKTFVVRNA